MARKSDGERHRPAGRSRQQARSAPKSAKAAKASRSTPRPRRKIKFRASCSRTSRLARYKHWRIGGPAALPRDAGRQRGRGCAPWSCAQDRGCPGSSSAGFERGFVKDGGFPAVSWIRMGKGARNRVRDEKARPAIVRGGGMPNPHLGASHGPKRGCRVGASSGFPAPWAAAIYMNCRLPTARNSPRSSTEVDADGSQGQVKQLSRKQIPLQVRFGNIEGNCPSKQAGPGRGVRPPKLKDLQSKLLRWRKGQARRSSTVLACSEPSTNPPGGTKTAGMLMMVAGLRVSRSGARKVSTMHAQLHHQTRVPRTASEVLKGESSTCGRRYAKRRPAFTLGARVQDHRP